VRKSPGAAIRGVYLLFLLFLTMGVLMSRIVAVSRRMGDEGRRTWVESPGLLACPRDDGWGTARVIDSPR